jgi:hypothetical protein
VSFTTDVTYFTINPLCDASGLHLNLNRKQTFKKNLVRQLTTKKVLSPRGILKFLRCVWTPKIFFYPILSALTTFICLELGFAIEMHVIASVFFVGIFFCFGIVMNTADERRFRAYEEVALIKANLISFWHITIIRSVEKDIQDRIYSHLMDIVEAIADYLLESDCDAAQERLFFVDYRLKYLESIVETFREHGFPSPELSRLHQWIAQIYFSFEKLMTIKEYRTPIILRMFLQFSLGLSVFVLAPEFAVLGQWGIAMSMIVAFLLISLIEIQNMIENPFSGDIDDVQFEFLSRFSDRLELVREKEFLFVHNNNSHEKHSSSETCQCR